MVPMPLTVPALVKVMVCPGAFSALARTMPLLLTRVVLSVSVGAPPTVIIPEVALPIVISEKPLIKLVVK